MKNLKSIPLWALKKQRRMEKAGQIPKFKPGDVVKVSDVESGIIKMFGDKGGVAVILETPPEGSQTICYAVDFGPKRGFLAWVEEERMTLLKKSVV